MEAVLKNLEQVRGAVEPPQSETDKIGVIIRLGTRGDARIVDYDAGERNGSVPRAPPFAFCPPWRLFKVAKCLP